MAEDDRHRRAHRRPSSASCRAALPHAGTARPDSYSCCGSPPKPPAPSRASASDCGQAAFCAFRRYLHGPGTPPPNRPGAGGWEKGSASAKTTLRPRDGPRPAPPPGPRAQPPKSASAPRFWPPLRPSTPPAGPPPPKTLVFSAFECPLQLRDFASPLPQRQVRQPDRILLAKPRAWRGPRCHGRLPEVGVLLLYGCGPWLPPTAFGAGSGRAPRAAAEGSCLATTPAAAGVRSPGRRRRRSGAPALVSGDGHSPAAP